MKITLIGAGAVGTALGTAWARAGHDIVFGVRDTTKAVAVRGATVAAPVQAAADADVVVLAVPWPAAVDTLIGLGDLAGKVVIDATNPLTPDMSGLEDHRLSGAERLAEAAPEARIVKAFNQTGAANMGDATIYPHPPVMFAASDDDTARQTVLQLVADAGFEGIDAGPLKAARTLEALAMLWIDLAMRRGLGTGFAFVIERPNTTAP